MHGEYTHLMKKADKALVESILKSLDENPYAVERAVLLIADAQTPDEYQWETTNVNNGVGFAASDARLGTELAKAIRGNTAFPPGKRLRNGTLDRARALVKRYARTQLLVAAKAKRAKMVAPST